MARHKMHQKASAARSTAGTCPNPMPRQSSGDSFERQQECLPRNQVCGNTSAGSRRAHIWDMLPTKAAIFMGELPLSPPLHSAGKAPQLGAGGSPAAALPPHELQAPLPLLAPPAGCGGMPPRAAAAGPALPEAAPVPQCSATVAAMHAARLQDTHSSLSAVHRDMNFPT